MNLEYINEKKMESLFNKVAKKIKFFAKHKNNICIFVQTENRQTNDLFVPCVYLYNYSKLNSKLINVFDDRTSTLADLKKKFDGIIHFKCVENASCRDVKVKINSFNEIEVVYFITNKIFKNEDYFCTFDLGFD